ncbi:hypothetical protein ACLS0F_06860 [Avibacterium endocarditidis]|uniref:DUF7210 domain-containing protein n=1 Tax=Avibacterium paragallinarum TaxID=728 RepID=A0A8B3TBX6_AVIPA|nr:hypothetical protein [Avibacterium paragallinarum]RZN60805.1 hypothetical protein EIG79_02640 [Avibacterium paragallinarum]
MNEKLLYAVIGAVAVLHNGKRYEVGETLELTQEEAQNIALYVELTESGKVKLAQQQRNAEEAQRKAEEAKLKAAEKKRQSSAEKNADSAKAKE